MFSASARTSVQPSPTNVHIICYSANPLHKFNQLDTIAPPTVLEPERLQNMTQAERGCALKDLLRQIKKLAVRYVLNHTIVPARDKVAAARFFADIFGLSFDARSGHFAPVRVNDNLTFLFDDDVSFESHHYAFHVNDAEFDSIFERVKQAGLAYGSAPWSLDNGKLNEL